MTIVRPRSRPALVLALVSGAQFMIILDLAIVNVALSAIQTDFAVSQSDLQWVVIGYGLALGGFLLLGGRLADVLGRRRVLLTGLAIFAVASLGAGLAGSLGPLVACRVVQGLGGALVSPAALSILTTTFAEGPPRNRALGVFGAVSGTAATVGLIAGGALTTGPGWQWVFLINVPIGAALVVGFLAIVPGGRTSARSSFDVAGAATVTAGLVLVVYAVNRSVEHGWLAPSTLGLLAGGVLLLGLFVAVEHRAAAPLVPLATFRNRALTSATLVAALVFGSFLATIYQGTLFLQQVLGYSALATGTAWLATSLSSLVVAGALAARLVGRFGARTVLVVGQLAMAGGLLHLSPRAGRRVVLDRRAAGLPGDRRGHRDVQRRRPGRRLHRRRRCGERPRQRDARDGPRGGRGARRGGRVDGRHRPHRARPRHRPARRRADRRVRASDARGGRDQCGRRPRRRRRPASAGDADRHHRSDHPGTRGLRRSRMSETTTTPTPLDRLEPHRRGLMAHCYRMLGSAFDADDAVQETMVRAWRGLDRYEGRGPFEAWLYRIATNVCLNMLRGRSRRALPMDLGPAASPEAGVGLARPGATWVGPVPDALVRAPAGQLDPAEAAIEHESLRLAFVTALQRLPPRQRAALILHDVLRWSNQEIAALFETTDTAIKSSLQRARATMGAAGTGVVLDPTAGELLERYIDAFQRYDVEALVDLLHEDATLSMPPHDLWLQGAADIAAWWRRESSACRGARFVPVRANGSPAIAQHRRAPDGSFQPFGVVVLEVAGGRIASIHAFLDPALVDLFDPPGLA